MIYTPKQLPGRGAAIKQAADQKTKSATGVCQKFKGVLVLMLGVIMAVSATMLLEGCMVERALRSAQVLGYLEDIYPDVSFTVGEMRSPGLPGTISYWTVYCSPADNKAVVFELHIEADGSINEISTYPQELANWQLNTDVREAFREEGLEVDAFLSPSAINPQSMVSGSVFLLKQHTGTADFGSAIENAHKKIYGIYGLELLSYVTVLEMPEEEYSDFMAIMYTVPFSDGRPSMTEFFYCVFAYKYNQDGGRYTPEEMNTYLKEGHIDE